MHTRKNIEFKTENNLVLRGWLYTPNKHKSPAPALIMTHGFGALKEHYLDKFASFFANAGFIVLVYDHRNFGESDASFPLEIDPNVQVEDMRNAISFVQSLPNVDPQKIGLWGTSFSGGIVLKVASLDKRIACVVAQVPFVIGHHPYLKLKKPALWESMQKSYAADRQARAEGKPAEMVAIITQDPKERAVIKQPEAYPFFTSIQNWQNKVTLRSIENSGNFDLISVMEKVSPIPLLFIVASNDTVNLTALALKAFDKALGPKKLVMIEGHHFTPYFEAFDQCAEEALNWFSEYLLK